MFRYPVYQLCSFYQGLGYVIRDLQRNEDLSLDVSVEYCGRVGRVLEGLALLVDGVELDESLVHCIKQLSEKLVSDAPERRSSVLRPQLKNIESGIELNLGKRTFMFVPQVRANVLYSIGKYEWASQFPNAMVDVIEATACYAFGRYTASVFHSMRVAESGLRHIAKTLRVSLKHKGRPMPIDQGTWSKVIDAIEKKIERTRRLGRLGVKRNRELAFYSDCAHQCAYMKDLYRNDVSHSGRPYKEAEALAVWGRVTDFMERLANGADGDGIVKKQPKLDASTYSVEVKELSQ